MNRVGSFNFFGVEARQIPCIPGSGAPTTATEGAVGCLYMDTDTGDVYKCTAAADGVHTWKYFGDRNAVTPQMFGAKGDGVTDDTEALQRAFAYAAENNVKCIIPKGVYNIAPTVSVEYSDGWTYTYCFEVSSNLHIEGANRDNCVLRVVTDKTSYHSVFCSYDPSKQCKNISIKNITIEQDYKSQSDDIATSGRNNPRNAVSLYAPSENVVLDNIYFKNCCGVNPININHYETTDVTLANCKFDFRYVRNINHYDRSVVYMECCNYLVVNNEVNGNFETLGGIELHGYNGTCRNNRVRDCYTAIHIAPRFCSPVETASIWVSENYVKDSCFGIKLWKNTSSKATKGFEGVYISGNKIDVNCSIADQQFFHYSGMLRPTILAGITAETYMDTTYKDIKITNNSIIYHNARDYTTVQAPGSCGIGFECPSDMDGIIINGNYIEGCFGNGIMFGNNLDNIKEIRNVEVTANIIKNCGRSTATNAVFQAYILLRHGNMRRVVVKNNILEKTDTHNVWSAFYNLSTSASVHEDVYFSKDNLITSPNPSDMAISNYSIANILYDEGPTTLRPTIAKKGHRFFDTAIDRLLVFTGSVWEIVKAGEDERNYELLETVTTTEEQVAISSAFEACSEVLCKVTIPASPNNAYVGIETNLGVISGLSDAIRSGGVTSYLTVAIFPRKGFYYAEISGPADNNTLAGVTHGMALQRVNAIPADNNLLNVRLASMNDSVPFPAGTVVEVWGVLA